MRATRKKGLVDMPNKQRHTPRPWQIKFGENHAPDECDIKISGDIFILADIYGPNYPHCEANAHLIAAPPEMHADSVENIEMLVALAEWLHMGVDGKDAPKTTASIIADIQVRVEASCAVIAKAEGKP